MVTAEQVQIVAKQAIRGGEEVGDRSINQFIAYKFDLPLEEVQAVVHTSAQSGGNEFYQAIADHVNSQQSK